MTPWKKRALWALVLLLVVAAGLRWVAARRAAAQVAAPTASAAGPAVLTLSAADVQQVRRARVSREIEITGSLAARQSAWVKARVAGELRQLTVREGEAVQAGQALGQIDTTELDWRLRQAEQQAETARAQQEVAERALANNQALVTQGFVSATTLDTSRANANGARASVQAALAAVELARKARADATLPAPISGLVSQRLVQPGERLALDARVLEIVDPRQMDADVALAADEVAQVRVGAPAQVWVDGISSPLTAQVSRINPAVSAGSRTVMVHLSLPPHPALRHGLFVRGRIELGQEDALVVDEGAIRIDQPTPYLLVLRGDTVERQEVQPGGTGRVKGQTVVRLNAGASEGTEVLAGRAGLVRPGTRVLRPASAPASAASR